MPVSKTGHYLVGGLIGSAIDGAIAESEQEDLIGEIAPLRQALEDYSFEQNFLDEFDARIEVNKLFPGSEVMFQQIPREGSEVPSGSIVIEASHYLSLDFSTLRVSITGYQVVSEETPSEQASRIYSDHYSTYVFEQEMPQNDATAGDRAANLRAWSGHSDLLEPLVRQGLSESLELMVRDLEGELAVDRSYPVKFRFNHEGREFWNGHMVDDGEDRVVVARDGKSFIASIPAHSIENRVKPLPPGTVIATNANASSSGAASAEPVSGSIPFEFMGVAESEIESGRYDRNLWARALVDVDGDEQRRKARYIELRAWQLSEVSKIDMSGTYVSSVTSNHVWRFSTQEQRSMQLVVRQEGNRIVAENQDFELKIIGEREGDLINFYILPNKMTQFEISGQWRIVPNSLLIEGNWSLVHSQHPASGNWNLRKIE